MLEEAGVDYEHVPVDWSAGESRTEDFLAINPNGKIPVLEDGELRLFESFAINYYIARTYAPGFWVDPGDEPAAVQWLAWGMGELEGPHDAANRSQTKIDGDRFEVSLNALRQVLSEQPFMVGDKFSVVDLNTACLLLRPQYQKVAKNDERLKEWFAECINRPALARAIRLKENRG